MGWCEALYYKYMNCFRPSSRASHGTPEMKDDVLVIGSSI